MFKVKYAVNFETQIFIDLALTNHIHFQSLEVEAVFSGGKILTYNTAGYGLSWLSVVNYCVYQPGHVVCLLGVFLSSRALRTHIYTDAPLPLYSQRFKSRQLESIQLAGYTFQYIFLFLEMNRYNS